ncbi:CCA tRNA nucleotidyltransferase [candidate division WOR-3 bacterium]|nr:CCA tRNA nucleotidyltransferase [candidate division WOR-3 bacterium]
MTADFRLTKEILPKIAQEIKKSGGRIFEVGGTVRDEILGRERKNVEIDAEVYGLMPETLEGILRKYGKVDLTGKSFAVYRLADLEVSLPRKDRSVGKSHREFDVEIFPGMDYAEACRRRDFTVNSILKDPLNGEIIDPLGGVKDIKTGILRACDWKHFAEDPLRPYRAMRFTATLGFPIDSTTMDLCRKTDISELPPERIFGEIKKMFLEADYAGRGLLAAHSLFLLAREPEILRMVDCSQDPLWHPEGNVFVHTVLSLNIASLLRERIEDEESKLVLMLSVLLHDIGKTVTSKKAQEGKKTGRIISPGHQPQGAKMAKAVLNRWRASKIVSERVSSLVVSHHRIYDLWRSRGEVTKGAMRRLMSQTELPVLKLLFLADKFGRGQALGFSEEISWLEKTLEEMKIEEDQLKPLVMGRHLLGIGVESGPDMGKLLSKVYEAQLDGVFESVEGGIHYAKKILADKGNA